MPKVCSLPAADSVVSKDMGTQDTYEGVAHRRLLPVDRRGRGETMNGEKRDISQYLADREAGAVDRETRRRNQALGTLREAVYQALPNQWTGTLDDAAEVMLKALVNAGWRPPRAQR